MEQLAADMHVDATVLFSRWWDTANKTPERDATNKYRTTNFFCNSESQPGLDGRSILNGFPYFCPRGEGGQAFTTAPFDEPESRDGYTAIAFINRFDLADNDSGRHCGEYRIVFAKNSGFTISNDRNLIIFEALVPNPKQPKPPKTPTPSDIFINLDGCRPIVEFWRHLSDPEICIPEEKCTVTRGRRSVSSSSKAYRMPMSVEWSTRATTQVALTAVRFARINS